jgi:hypothetical protein
MKLMLKNLQCVERERESTKDGLYWLICDSANIFLFSPEQYKDKEGRDSANLLNPAICFC